MYRKSNCREKIVLYLSYLHKGIFPKLCSAASLWCLYRNGTLVCKPRLLNFQLAQEGVKFDLYTNDLWAVRHSALSQFQQAVRKVSTYLNGIFNSKAVWGPVLLYYIYHQTFNIRRTLVGNKIVDHSDVVEASPVGAAPTTPSFLTEHLASMDWAKTTARQDKKHLSLGIWSFDGK